MSAKSPPSAGFLISGPPIAHPTPDSDLRVTRRAGRLSIPQNRAEPERDPPGVSGGSILACAPQVIGQGDTARIQLAQINAGSPMEATLIQLQQQLDRVERKLDTLIKALAEEEDGPSVASTLDGESYRAGERDQSQSL